MVFPFVQLAILVVSLLIAYATQPRPKAPKPPTFEEFDFPQSEEGTAQAVFFGDVWTEEWMVLSVCNYRTSPVRR